MGDQVIEESRLTVAVRDPVWKHVWMTEEVSDLLRSPPFLRLHRIKQLGPTELVYPGATHTRAAHSIGVYHLALRALRALVARGADWVSKEGCASFLVAALLHDLGHFPYTHSLKELPLEPHERLTARLVRESSLARLVARAGADPERVAAIVDRDAARDDGETRFFRRILSGVLDPDKLDYLNRDAYYCGVPYGIQDTDFVLSRISPDRERGIVVDSRAIMSVESVLFSKYLMYRSVYWHRQVRMATAMMKKALLGALGANAIDPEELYGVDDEGLFAFVSSRDFPARECALALRRRELYRVISEHRLADSPRFPAVARDLSSRGRLEAKVADTLSVFLGSPVGPDEVLIDVPEDISFESDLFVSDEGRPFSESSTVFSAEVVSGFTASLRVLRLALHPRAAALVAGKPGAGTLVAKCLEVSYT